MAVVAMAWLKLFLSGWASITDIFIIQQLLLGLIKDKFQNLIKAVQQDIAIFAIKPVPVNSYHGVKSSLFTNDSQKKYADLSNCAETFLSVSSLLHLICHFLEIGYLI